MIGTQLKVLFLNRTDIFHPRAGNEEIYTYKVASHLSRNGHEVTLFCTSFCGTPSREIVNGIKVVREGGQKTVRLQACTWYYSLNGNGNGNRYSGIASGETGLSKFDVVVDVLNGLPFFTPLYMKNEKKVLLVFQLAGSAWLHKARSVSNVIYRAAEYAYLHPYRMLPAITISDSAKGDLKSMGFWHENIKVVPVGANHYPSTVLSEKAIEPTIVFIGRLSRSNRVDQIIRAFTRVRRAFPESKLLVCGKGEADYENYLKKMAGRLAVSRGVEFLGGQSNENELEMLKSAHFLLLTSDRDWGITVVEAASVGTPSIIYDLSALRDSVISGETGIVCTKNEPDVLAQNIIDLINNPSEYKRLQMGCLRNSKSRSWQRTGDEFERSIAEIATTTCKKIFIKSEAGSDGYLENMSGAEEETIRKRV